MMISGISILSRKILVTRRFGAAAWAEFFRGVAKRDACFRRLLTAETPVPLDAFLGFHDALMQRFFMEDEPAYVRLMAEMNCHWNVYSAYGPHRDRAHSTSAYKAAWRRTTVILRGGPGVDAQLRALHQAPLPADAGDLPPASVAMQWVL